MSETARCTALTTAGRQCKHTTNLRDFLCIFHDPARHEVLREMRQRGAVAATASREKRRHMRLALLANTAGPRPKLEDTLEGIVRFQCWVVEAGARGELSRPDVMVLSHAVATAHVAINKRDLERRWKAVSVELARLKKAQQTP